MVGATSAAVEEAMNMFSVGGAVSGLDTESMISQLMQLERAPIRQIQSRQAELRRVDDAWGKVTTRLSSLQTAVDAVASRGALSGKVTASSSDEAVAAVSATEGAQQGSLAFSVTSLAAAHQSMSGSFTTADDTVGAGTYTVTVNGVAESVTTTGTTTLSQLAADVDQLDGVHAQVVKVADGDHRMIVTSAESGTANSHAVTFDALDAKLASVDLRAAADATLELGDASGSTVTVTRSSNQITDLMEGVTIDLAALGDTSVTVAQDVETSVESVQNLVDEINATLNTLGDLTRYDPTSKQGGVLMGDMTARRLTSDLRMALSDVVGDGPYNYAGSVGISLTREGTFTLDEAELTTALEDDPQAVSNLFSRFGSATGDVTYDSLGASTVGGSYDVSVSKLATVAAATGSAYTQPPTDPQPFTITTSDGKTVTVDVSANASVGVAVQTIRDALTAAGVSSINAAEGVDTDGNPVIELTGTRQGSDHWFEIQGAFTESGLTDGTYTGTDVEGTFTDPDTGTVLAATGSGNELRGTEGDANGLTVDVTSGVSGAVGSVSVTNGLGGRLTSVLEQYTDYGGMISSTRDSISTRLRNYDDDIAAYDRRLEIRETTLRRQFAAMETSMSGLMQQGSWMASQMGAQQG